MELVAKFTDAASMFWSALDERERMLVVYGLAWVAIVVVAGAAQRSRERLKQEIREEIFADGRSS